MSDSLWPHESQHPGLPVHHQLLESTQTMSIESMMPSSHLILCCPLLLLPPILPSIRVFSMELTNYVTQLLTFQQTIWELWAVNPASESNKLLFEPGTEVLIKTLGPGEQSLKPFWEGPYQVFLSSPTAVRVPGIDSWVHHTRLKKWHPDPSD